MKQLLKACLRILLTACFFCLIIVYATAALISFSERVGIQIYPMPFPSGLINELPAPLWFCILISCGTVLAAFICIWLCQRLIPPDALDGIDNKFFSFSWKNPAAHQENMRRFSLFLFCICAALVFCPIIASFFFWGLLGLESTLLEPISQFLSYRYFWPDDMERWETILMAKIGIENCLAHQCLLFLSASFFFSQNRKMRAFKNMAEINGHILKKGVCPQTQPPSGAQKAICLHPADR